MNPWQILGIEPTADERLIKQAYAKALKHNKPDKNPEGFKALRDAYEQALRTRYYYDQSDDYDDDEFDDQENSSSSDDLTPNQPSNDTYINQHQDQTQDKLKLNKDDLDLTQADKVADEFQEIFITINNTISHNITGEHDITDSPNPQQISSDLPDLLEKWYDLMNISRKNGLTDKVKDGLLLDMIQGQLENEFTQLTLDEKIDYEEYLIEFFYHYNDTFLKNTFAFAFDFFDWQGTLDSYKSDHYPWVRIRYTLERYQSHFPEFENIEEFFIQVETHYPTIYRYYNPKTYHKGVFGFYLSLLLKSLRPSYLSDFSQELTQLHTKLLTQKQKVEQSNELHHTLDFYDEILKNPNYLILHKFGNSPQSYFYNIAWIIAVSMLIALPVMFYTPHMGIIGGYCIMASVLIFVIFWAKRLELFISPHDYKHQSPQTQPLFAGLIDIVLYIFLYKVYIMQSANTDITPFFTPNYYIAHFVGLLLWRFNLKKLTNATADFIDSQWLVAFLLVCNAVILPVFAILTHALESKSMVHYSPLLWLLLSVPLILQLTIDRQDKPWAILVTLRNMTLSLNQVAQVIFMVFFGIYAFIIMASKQLMLGAVLGIGLGLLIYSIKGSDDETDQ